MSEREKILDKIRKLQAHADSAADIGNEEEAQAFAAKVQELLTAYKLSAADVGSRPEAREPVDAAHVTWEETGLKVRRTRVGWAERLAFLCARAYYCEFVISSSRGAIGFFIGTDTDRRVCKFMFVTLARFLERLAEREYNREFYRHYVPGDSSSVAHVRGFRAGFMSGFLMRLSTRFDEEVRPKADPKAQAATTAIVLVRRDAIGRVRDWMKDNFQTRSCRSTSMDGGSRAGQLAGAKAANELNLSPNPIEREGRAQGVLR